MGNPDIYTIAVTPVNFEDIVEKSAGHPFEEGYSVENLKAIRAEAQAKGHVAFVCFLDDAMWVKEEKPGTAVHGELDGFRY